MTFFILDNDGLRLGSHFVLLLDQKFHWFWKDDRFKPNCTKNAFQYIMCNSLTRRMFHWKKFDLIMEKQKYVATEVHSLTAPFTSNFLINPTWQRILYQADLFRFRCNACFSTTVNWNFKAILSDAFYSVRESNLTQSNGVSEMNSSWMIFFCWPGKIMEEMIKFGVLRFEATLSKKL